MNFPIGSGHYACLMCGKQHEGRNFCSFSCFKVWQWRKAHGFSVREAI